MAFAAAISLLPLPPVLTRLESGQAFHARFKAQFGLSLAKKPFIVKLLTIVIGCSMHESDPVKIYMRLIVEGRSPYVDVAKLLLEDLETRMNQTGHVSDSIYTINLKRLQQELEVRNGLKMSSHSIGRTLRAFFWKTGLREGEEYYVSKSGRLAARYHLLLTKRTRTAFRSQNFI